jgi:hypothetical protein
MTKGVEIDHAIGGLGCDASSLQVQPQCVRYPTGQPEQGLILLFAFKMGDKDGGNGGG